MLGNLLGMVGLNLKRQVRSLATTVIFALAGTIMIVLALAFGIAALFEWLKLQYGTLPALGILGGSWALLGIIFFAVAFLSGSNTSCDLALNRAIRASLRYAFYAPEASRAYVRAHSQEMSDDVCDAHIKLYVNELTLDVGEEGLRAIARLVGAGAPASSRP